MEEILFNKCTISNKLITIYKESKNITFAPLMETLIENGSATIEGNSITITGQRVIIHIHFHRTYVKDLNYIPIKDAIKYTYFRKKPYVKGWVEDSEHKIYERKFINYRIQII